MEKGYKINVLDDIGAVYYDGHYGCDADIPRIARVSTGSLNKGEEQDKKLLGYLYRNMHSSPFEFCSITYKLDLPLFVRDQVVRHRCGRYNIHSFRYSAPEEKFYVPKEWREQASKNHQDSIKKEGWNPEVESIQYGELHSLLASGVLNLHCNDSYRLYQELLKSGIAREMARMVLGTNIYTSMYMQMDLNNLMKFFRLRIHPHAQYEVRVYAEAMFNIFEQLFPQCAECYKKYKMVIVN
jgi:thymidylate synthase (FAD)